MIQDQLRNDFDVPSVRLLQKLFKIGKRSIIRMDIAVFGYIKAIIFQGRRKEWQQPDGVDSQIIEVVELLNQPLKIANAIAVPIKEGPHGYLINDRILKP